MHRADLSKLSAIAEAHYTDLYGEAMRRFHDKYAEAGPEYFVNFNPVISDERDKTIIGQQMDNFQKTANLYDFDGDAAAKNDRHHSIFKTPEHHDPIGTYGYPAEYVANHWYDIQYGSDMTNLRVMKVKLSPDKTLQFNGMNRDDFLTAMKRLNLEFTVQGDGQYSTRQAGDAIMIYEAIFEEEAPSTAHFRVNSYAKCLFKLIQSNYQFKMTPTRDDDDDDEDGGYGSAGEFRYEGHLSVKGSSDISQQQQAQRLLKAGYEVVLDRAKSPLEATIFPDEPEQCICLTKRAYEIVEIFKLPPGVKEQGTTPGRETAEKVAAKASGFVAKAMGDTIAEPADHFFKGPGRIANLETLRGWLATEKVVAHPFNHLDPTADSIGCRAWITGKGNLILITMHYGSENSLVDKRAERRTHDAVDYARVRPGEDQSEVEGNLHSYVKSGLSKASHRLHGDLNVMSFMIAMLTPAAAPVYIDANHGHSLHDIPQLVTSALRAASVKAPFRRITLDTLTEFKRDVTKTVADFKAAAIAKSRPAPIDVEQGKPDQT